MWSLSGSVSGCMDTDHSLGRGGSSVGCDHLGSWSRGSGFCSGSTWNFVCGGGPVCKGWAGSSVFGLLRLLFDNLFGLLCPQMEKLLKGMDPAKGVCF